MELTETLCYIQCDPAGMVVIHLAGTCQLGKVVDSKLRVLGTRGLRVVDASVMPSLPSGNTHATTMMIAEKAAATILEARVVQMNDQN